MLMMLLALNTAHAGKNVGVDEVRVIEAPAEVVWAYVSDFTTWKDWTAWNPKRDPEATWTYEGDPGTVGHSTAWTGPELDKGKMVATAAEAASLWEYGLYFGNSDKNYPGSITLVEANGTTEVTWSWNMKMTRMGAALFGNKVSAMVAQDFAEGLATLEKVAEQKHRTALLSAAQQAVTDHTAAVEAATASLTAAQAEATRAAEVQAAAEASLAKARRKADKDAARTALDEVAAATVAAKAAEETAAAALEQASAALAQAKDALATVQAEE